MLWSVIGQQRRIPLIAQFAGLGFAELLGVDSTLPRGLSKIDSHLARAAQLQQCARVADEPTPLQYNMKGCAFLSLSLLARCAVSALADKGGTWTSPKAFAMRTSNSSIGKNR